MSRSGPQKVMVRWRRARLAAGGLSCMLLGASCVQQMEDQPRYTPLAASDFFDDGRSARPYIPDTVARGQLWVDDHLYRGEVNGRPATTFPFPITTEVLVRGQERYDIFCSPCHDRVGRGAGMIVQRGFRPPPSLHLPRLRAAPPGHVVQVITRGFGAMMDYGDRIPARDRWAIAAYIRALQLSQQAPVTTVPLDERTRLEAGTP